MNNCSYDCPDCNPALRRGLLPEDALPSWDLAEQDPHSRCHSFAAGNHRALPKPVHSLLNPSEVWQSWAFPKPPLPPLLSLPQGRHISSHLIFLEPQAGGFGVALSAVAAFAFFSLFVSHHQAIPISEPGCCGQNWALDALKVVPRGLTRPALAAGP